MTNPSPNGHNGHPGGRDARGRFTVGHPGGPGNPHAARTAELRSMLLSCVSDDDIVEVVAKLITLAKGGELAAIRELLDRVLGKPTQHLDAHVEYENLSESELCDLERQLGIEPPTFVLPHLTAGDDDDGDDDDGDVPAAT